MLKKNLGLFSGTLGLLTPCSFGQVVDFLLSQYCDTEKGHQGQYAPCQKECFLGSVLRQWPTSRWGRICFPLTPESLFFGYLWHVPAPSNAEQPGCRAAYDTVFSLSNPCLGRNLPSPRAMHFPLLGLLLSSLVKTLRAVAVCRTGFHADFFSGASAATLSGLN